MIGRTETVAVTILATAAAFYLTARWLNRFLTQPNPVARNARRRANRTFRHHSALANTNPAKGKISLKRDGTLWGGPGSGI